jgi:hypothetical protein
MTERNFWIRTAITHLELEEAFSFNEFDAKDILLSQNTEKKRAEVGLPSENL